ncbi:TetR/AcrR family transcriptional regulator [Nocardiopsis sp. RSe5-2]|uniref:TetR/AcrR family transcriptional regulator n=1 Tax=Nocardiopsis endophytica TaxID=3018445 RepID=A0ABT4U991_9ACTN|nr:TetR/AcrR family transcriptional regulator [Nocardiopsis endophytica]MDA2813519.1 TetR/AcrR family transcriptional regulator [Nocardiopsis endophytica]
MSDAPRPGRPRSSEADAAILDAALDLLIEHGVDGTSVEQVAKRAGVTRATVYRRHPDKTRMLVAAITRAQGDPADLPECDGAEQLLSYWAQALADPRLRLLTLRLMTAVYDHPELGRAYMSANVERRDAWVRAALERDHARGAFPEGTDLQVVQRILTGAVADHLTTHPGPAPAEEIERLLLDVLRQTGYRSRS